MVILSHYSADLVFFISAGLRKEVAFLSPAEIKKSHSDKSVLNNSKSN